MANKILKVAIHDLNKEEKGFSVKLGKDNLPVTPIVQRVIDTLNTFYNRRTSKSHGKFAVDTTNFPTQAHLKTYVDSNYKEFYALTSSMMLTLRKDAGQKASATGGHVFFAQFERDEKNYLMVSIINDKLGAALTKDMDVQDATHLDMDGFRFAGRINITAWLAGDDRYISFLKGKGDIAEYFKEFLGCDTFVLEKEDTQTLVKALTKFADDKGFKGDAKQEFLKKAKDICDLHARNKTELSIQAFSNEMIPDNPDELIEALTDPDLKLNDNFVPHSRSLNRLVRFQVKTKSWSLEFERDALSTGPITYDVEANALTIREIPAELAVELRRELQDDQADL